MLIEPYQLEDLKLAWCYRVSYSWRRYRSRPQPALAGLDQPTLNSLLEPYDIHMLETGVSPTEVRLLASLLPGETVAVAASKAKGRVNKWLREQLSLAEPEKLLSRSYFACTSGESTAEDVAGYLDQQSEHHGYASRPCPPVFVQSYPIISQDEQRLSPRHAVAALPLHIDERRPGTDVEKVRRIGHPRGQAAGL